MIRYAITAIKKDGLRHLAFHNWATSHRDTKEEADKYLQAIKDSNSKETIEDLVGTELQVTPVDCYDHGEAKGTIFGD